MRSPWVNVALLILLLLQTVTGYAGFTNNSAGRAWLLWLHGIGAYALLLLLLAKGQVIWSVWRRGKRWTPARATFVLLLLLLLGTLLLGLLWTARGPIYLFGFSLVSLHIYLAIPLMLLLAFHFWRMRWIWRVAGARDRRAFLRLSLAAAAGAVAWRLGELLRQARRFSGSYETGSFTGNFPRVSWINDRPGPVDVDRWQLEVDGLVERPLLLSYEQLSSLPRVVETATLDCTGGWYSTQIWEGVRLGHLLAEAGVLAQARSVVVTSITGYWRRFPLAEIEAYTLAMRVAGAPLTAGHGFPARLVAANRRGFAWVKWVTSIHVDGKSPLWQPPLPLQ